MSSQAPTRVLVVDDERSIREVLEDFMTVEGYEVVAVANGEAALEAIVAQRFDAALIDLKMPGMDGLEVLARFGELAPHLVPVMMTGYGTVETATAAMRNGAYDYVLKPFKVREVIGLLERGLEQKRLEAENVHLKDVLKQTVQAFANLLEDKDPYTRGHSERVSRYARMIAEGMGLSDEQVDTIADAALVHDIGKLGIRFEDLNKAEPLTESEYEMFKSHTTRGKWMLEPIEFMHELIPGVYHHHERWDGKGYPLGLVGEETPLMARILSVADTYDAMTSHRAYRRALPHDVAVRELEAFAGTQFDPQVVEVFVREIARDRQGQSSKAQRWKALEGISRPATPSQVDPQETAQETAEATSFDAASMAATSLGE
jgi:putative nucleotidyltransferase with HDIG domain